MKKLFFIIQIVLGFYCQAHAQNKDLTKEHSEIKQQVVGFLNWYKLNHTAI